MKTTRQTIVNEVESEFGKGDLKFAGSSVFEDGVFQGLNLNVIEKRMVENASPEGGAVETQVSIGELRFEYLRRGNEPLNSDAVDFFIDFLNELKDSLITKDK